MLTKYTLESGLISNYNTYRRLYRENVCNSEYLLYTTDWFMTLRLKPNENLFQVRLTLCES